MSETKRAFGLEDRKGESRMIKELDVYDLYEQLVELGLFTAEELKLLTRINGYNIETLNNAIYARYGVGGMKLISKFLQKGEDNNV